MKLGRQTWTTVGLFAALALFVAALYMVFIYVPTEAQMGTVQRIFYFHVPVAWLGLLSYCVLFAASILYLVKRSTFWDNLASSAGEIGFIFTTLFLVSGSLWAKPAWGHWWTWTPRLTTGLILWFIYIAYHAVRFYASEKQQGARFASVVGIIGFVDVPIIALATTVWQSDHPGALIFEGGLVTSMKVTLMTSITAFTVFYAFLLAIRTGLKRRESEMAELRESLE